MKLFRIATMAFALLIPTLAIASTVSESDCCALGGACCGHGCPFCHH